MARFRSPIDDQHYSAFFELFLHEIVLNAATGSLRSSPLPGTKVAWIFWLRACQEVASTWRQFWRRGALKKKPEHNQG